MSQFHVYVNPVRSRREHYPYVAQLQSDLAASAPREVIVAPLVPAAVLNVRGSVLLPVVNLEGKEFTVCVPMLGSVPPARLGQPIGDLREARGPLLTAIDHLFTGG